MRMCIFSPGYEGEPLKDSENNKTTKWMAHANMDNGRVYNCGEVTFLGTWYWIHINKAISSGSKMGMQ